MQAKKKKATTHPSATVLRTEKPDAQNWGNSSRGTERRRNGKTQRAEGGKDAAATGIVSFHSLIQGLKNTPVFKLEIQGGNYNEYNYTYEGDFNRGISRLVDTEEKQLQAIRDIYAILQAQPGSTIHKKQWTRQTEPLDVLYYLLRKLGAYAKGEEWTIDYQPGTTDRYCFVVYKEYAQSVIRSSAVFLGVDFLPGLKARDPLLHDLFIEFFAFANRFMGVPLWDEGPDFPDAIDGMIDAADIDPEILGGEKVKRYAAHSSIYTTTAAQYLQLIKKAGEQYSAEPITAAKEFRSKVMFCSKNSPTSNRKSGAYYRFLQAADFVKENPGFKISRYSFVPEFNPRKDITINPLRGFNIVWCSFNSDIVTRAVWNQMKEQADRHGWFKLLDYKRFFPGEKITPVTRSKIPSDFYWIMQGLGYHLIGTNKKYYYKNQSSYLTESEHLLLKLEAAQKKNDEQGQNK